jgi:hypothetical protein
VGLSEHTKRSLPYVVSDTLLGSRSRYPAAPPVWYYPQLLGSSWSTNQLGTFRAPGKDARKERHMNAYHGVCAKGSCLSASSHRVDLWYIQEAVPLKGEADAGSFLPVFFGIVIIFSLT